MFVQKTLVFLLLLCWLSLDRADAIGEFKYESTSRRRIDFSIGYPIVQLKGGATASQSVTAEVAFNYQFFFNERIAMIFCPSIWFLPIDIAGRKETIYGSQFETGILGRFLPRTYFDPSISIYGGVGFGDAGKRDGAAFTYPIGSRLGANLYRNQTKFSDPELALNLSFGTRYYFKEITYTKPLFFDVLLAFRGSF